MNDDRNKVYLQKQWPKNARNKMNDHSQQQKILTVNILLCQLFYVIRPPCSAKARSDQNAPTHAPQILGFSFRQQGICLIATDS